MSLPLGRRISYLPAGVVFSAYYAVGSVTVGRRAPHRQKWNRVISQAGDPEPAANQTSSLQATYRGWPNSSRFTSQAG